MENYFFRYSFEDNQTRQYEILVAGKIVVVSPVGSFQNPVGIKLAISQKILSVEEEHALIAVTIEKVETNVEIPSDQLPEPGKRSIMRMNKLGQVFWVEGIAAWQGAEYSMMRFPSGPLRPGEYWDQQVEEANGTASPFFTRYIFNGLNKKNRRLAEFRTELYTGHPDSSESILAGEGRFLFSLDECWIMSCENRIEYKFSMPFPENPAQKIITHTCLNIEMERV